MDLYFWACLITCLFLLTSWRISAFELNKKIEKEKELADGYADLWNKAEEAKHEYATKAAEIESGSKQQLDALSKCFEDLAKNYEIVMKEKSQLLVDIAAISKISKNNLDILDQFKEQNKRFSQSVTLLQEANDSLRKNLESEKDKSNMFKAMANSTIGAK
jgi:DNA repair exonuclease SbcCD ATPase subunit